MYPLLFIIVISIFSGSIHDILGIGKDYKSEWFSNDGNWESVILKIILSSIICLLSTTIFLNNYSRVKNNLVLSALSWFTFPMILIGYILGKHICYLINSKENFGSESIFVLTVTLPHLVGLVLTFISFRIKG
jgi:hypothetical protein